MQSSTPNTTVSAKKQEVLLRLKIPTTKDNEILKNNQRVHGKTAFTLTDPPDSFIESLKIADDNFFQNVRKLLIIGTTSPVDSTEVEKAA